LLSRRSTAVRHLEVEVNRSLLR